MEAVIYLGAPGQQLGEQPLRRGRVARTELAMAELHPSATGLHALGLRRPVVNVGL